MFFLLFFLAALVSSVKAHGYLCEPPARNSAWFCGHPHAPSNYNLMALNAGGVGVMYPNYPSSCPQYYQSCGDPISGEGLHNAGGTYDIGPLSRYRPGQSVSITVVITAHHQGHFLLQLCPTYPEEESCFFTIQTFSIQDNIQPQYTFSAALPSDISCERCVLRWIYVTNNSPGNAPELFLNCADVSIQ
jgi:hypothetical protein